MDSVNDLVTKVLRRAGSQRLERLIISGHSRPGWQSVGCGQHEDTTGDRSLQPGSAPGKLEGAAALAMPKLAGHFTNNGVVILAGCKVAGEETRSYGGASYSVDGKDLLRRVSRALGGIAVEGGTSNQNALSPIPFGKVIRCNYDSCRVVSGW